MTMGFFVHSFSTYHQIARIWTICMLVAGAFICLNSQSLTCFLNIAVNHRLFHFPQDAFNQSLFIQQTSYHTTADMFIGLRSKGNVKFWFESLHLPFSQESNHLEMLLWRLSVLEMHCRCFIEMHQQCFDVLVGSCLENARKWYWAWMLDFVTLYLTQLACSDSSQSYETLHWILTMHLDGFF